MPQSSQPDVTELLVEWSKGSEEALQKLVPLVYRELRRLAGEYLRRERRGHTLQPTALVNEVFLRLVGQSGSSGRAAPSSSASPPR